MNVTRAYILAGGQSSRFGLNKARAMVGRTPMIRHVANFMLGCVQECIAVGHSPGEYEDLGLRTIVDLVPGNGPLSGLHAAICDAPPESSFLLVACDMVALRSEWITTLLERAAPGLSAVAFRDEFWEPMPAIYSASLRDTVEAHLASNTLSLQRLLSAVGATSLTRPADWRSSPSINTPDELSRFVAELDRESR
jgi:molybdopterin-guanine dinucleotide biosynthesis protein A